MNIYIDESGSFVSAEREGSWNAVAAFAIPVAARKELERIVGATKRSRAARRTSEIKIGDLDESAYRTFLEDLHGLDGSLLCIATDSGLNTEDRVTKHQQVQVRKLLEHLDKMQFESGRQGVRLLAAQIEALSPQLYVQLICQIELMYDAVSRAVTYYVQRVPAALREFRWRIDRKNVEKTSFEDAFEKLAPALLQTISLTRPFPMIKGFDYSSMKQYKFAPGKAPTYLKDTYGIETGTDGLNIQKLIRGNIAFIDSKNSAGIQVVDLIVSGIRKCLRKRFDNNELIAARLGALMVQAMDTEPPLRLVSFGFDATLDPATARLVHLMRHEAKPMLK
jgi:hypothetical protein